MNECIRQLRKFLDMTQQEFSDRLGVARNNIAGYETGKRSPSNAVISLICREFKVNEVWLRTGEGGDENMFSRISSDDKYSLSLGKLTIEQNEFVKNAVNYLANTDPEKLKIIEEFMKNCLGIEE